MLMRLSLFCILGCEEQSCRSGKTATTVLRWDCWVTPVVVLYLIKGPGAQLLVTRQQTVCGGQAWGSPSSGDFPSASRK